MRRNLTATVANNSSNLRQPKYFVNLLWNLKPPASLHLTNQNCCMNPVSLPIVHPAFRSLKRNGRVLHLAAAGLILTHAITHFGNSDPNPIYLACLFLIALDILILVFAVRNLLNDMPRVNLFFRFIEFIFFMGIGVEMMVRSNWVVGAIHIVLSIAYIYLFYCEKKINQEEYVAIHHTGITIPSLPESKFFIWSQISTIQADYHSITVNTSLNKSYHFELQEKMDANDLEQIDQFCRYYLPENYPQRG